MIIKLKKAPDFCCMLRKKHATSEGGKVLIIKRFLFYFSK